MAFKPDKRLMKLYGQYNADYFDGMLPECQVGWSDKMAETDMAGVSLVMEEEDVVIRGIALDKTIKPIVIQCAFKGAAPFYKQVLLHEMAHIKLYPYMHHGRPFNEEIVRLVLRGAYKGLL